MTPAILAPGYVRVWSADRSRCAIVREFAAGCIVYFDGTASVPMSSQAALAYAQEVVNG